MRTTSLETAVISRMLADPDFSPTRRPVDPTTLEVTERSLTEVGFITSFARTSATKLLSDDASARWGKVVGRLNAEVSADFVVYVDEGYLTAIEGCTFGGEPWPSEVVEFDLTDLPNP